MIFQPVIFNFYFVIGLCQFFTKRDVVHNFQMETPINITSNKEGYKTESGVPSRFDSCSTLRILSSFVAIFCEKKITSLVKLHAK